MKRILRGCSLFGFITAIIFLNSCVQNQTKKLFTKLNADESGIQFQNDIHDSDTTHSFINEFGYMGGGVGIGDFNNDGLKDIFFSGNQVSCRLYINKGNNKFEDITISAGVSTNVWATGVSIADINSDGYDDIYVCTYGKNLLERAKNLLFINQRNLTFKEEAGNYGLADTGYSTQAAFLDYDLDGDLDIYLANYLLAANNTNRINPIDKSGFSPANDKLYRNDGDSSGVGHPFFTDVTLAAGIKEDGYGLGLTVSDFNNDNWPDIYVANDFVSNDELWLNNKNGTFTNVINSAVNHQSYSSMGTDAADINNDALADIVTLDMLPEKNRRRKMQFFFMNYERYQAEREMGYAPEFMRNMLQLNNGNYKKGDTSIPFFSEVGQMAGINATDWSWSVLLADFNNDGWKDIHITNGIGRDFINGDFLEFSNQVFNGSQTQEEQHEVIKKKLASLKHINIPNYLYRNNKDLTFADISEEAGVNEPSMSNGAAYADLDNDGDLDMVVNNINEKAFVFMNNTIVKGEPINNHFFKVHLKGSSLNKNAFGAKVLLYSKGQVQMQEQYPVRGYFSCVDGDLLFGLGNNILADSLVVIWPNNKKQLILNLPADTTIIVSHLNADEYFSNNSATSHQTFSDITSAAGILCRHMDVSFNDFDAQRLLPQKYSQAGPYITTGDIDKNGTTDFFIGGGFNSSGKIFLQQKTLLFSSKNLIDSIKMEEDVDCVLFDADSDGDEDLLITSGDTRYPDSSVYYQPRLYLNNGKGNFSLQTNSIPASVRTIAGCVSTCDYDADGDLDVFIGGRVSKKYPLAPKSFILQNNKGIFTDVTAKVCPALENPGMITSAVWADFDNDKIVDLVIAGDWMPIRFFKNNKISFREVTNETGLTQMNGMWRSLIAVDIDIDGDLDFVAGNLGTNNDYHVSETQPLELFAADIDNNGFLDPVQFYYLKDENGLRRSYPAISRSQFSEQVPLIKKQFLFYKDYAQASFRDIFNSKVQDRLQKFYCNETRSCYFENTGGAKFVKHTLPAQVQFAPVNSIVCDDFDNDGIKDILLAGNEYQAEVMMGRYDASYGCFLKGTGKKSFQYISPVESGFMIRGDVKDLAVILMANGEKRLLAAVNNDEMRMFRINQ